MAILKDLIVQNAARVIGPVYANSFVKAGGTSSQFLKADGSVDTNTYALSSAVPSFAAAGSATQPVYLSAANTFSTCTTYAGGTAVTLNGTSVAGSTASFYAPTSTGTSGQFLKWPASGNVPTWTSFPTTLAGYGITDANISNGVITLGTNSITPLTTFNNANNYAFKVISTSNNSSTSNINENTVDIIAGSNADTLTIKGGNNWIHSTGDSTNKIITISHLVPKIGDKADTIYAISWDDAGHIVNANKGFLNNLVDVDSSNSPSSGDFLGWNGTQWAYRTPTNTDYVYFCSTPAATAAKTASSMTANIPVANHYYWVYISTANSASSALTFSANSSTAATIYINGTASSSSNNTLPAGLYFVYYSGTGTGKGWYFNTNGEMTIMGNQFDGIETDLNVVQNLIDSSDTNEYPLLATGTVNPNSTAQEANYSSTKLNKDGDIVFNSNSTKCSLKYDSTNLCLNVSFV